MFTLDSRIAADTYPVKFLPLCEVRLKRGTAGNPWLILVPQRPNLSEIHDLSLEDRRSIIDEIARASGALKAVCACDKINVAAFGNMVEQLHVHVIARFVSDEWWPGAIDMAARPWAWTDEARVPFCNRLKDTL